MAETQLDRIEEMVRVLFDGRAGQRGHPMDRKDDAPEQVREGVEGFEKVFGPKPKGGTADQKTWMRQIPKTTKVHKDIPEEYEAGAMALAAATGIIPIFVEYEGVLKAALTVEPDPWLIEPALFLGSELEALKRRVLDDRRTKKK